MLCVEVRVYNIGVRDGLLFLIDGNDDGDDYGGSAGKRGPAPPALHNGWCSSCRPEWDA